MFAQYVYKLIVCPDKHTCVSYRLTHIYIYIYYTKNFMQGQGLAKSRSHAHV